MEDYKKLEDINRKMKTYKLMFMGLTIFLLINMYLDYQNIQTYNKFYKQQFTEYILFDIVGKKSYLYFRKIKIHYYVGDFSNCESSEVKNELENTILPNNKNLKLLIAKDKNSNLFKTTINDTCYQFKVYADPGIFGKLFE